MVPASPGPCASAQGSPALTPPANELVAAGQLHCRRTPDGHSAADADSARPYVERGHGAAVRRSRLAVRMNRRDFLRQGAEALTASLALSAWVADLQSESRYGAGPGAGAAGTAGWNDGLNTVVPFRDPLYRQARPSLAITDGPALDRDLILHPALAPLHPIWKALRLAFALGVGWPDPNRSHFKASDQWATSSVSGSGAGWLAAAIDRRGLREPLVALGPSGYLALEGGKAVSLQMAPALLHGRVSAKLDPARAGNYPLLSRILELEADSRKELIRLRRALRPLPQGVEIPRGGLGQQVALALQLIGSGAAPPVIQMAHAGYDTHAAQVPGTHGCLPIWRNAMRPSIEVCILRSRPQVTLLATSEFGRRLRENASRGTDHGSASIALLLGDDVPHPILGTYPALTQLDNRGDPQPSFSPSELFQHVLTL